MKWTQSISDEWWKKKRKTKRRKWTFGLFTSEAVCWNRETGHNNAALELKINEMRNGSGTMNFSCAFWSWFALVFYPFHFISFLVYLNCVCEWVCSHALFVAVAVNLIPSNVLVSFLALIALCAMIFLIVFFSLSFWFFIITQFRLCL